MQRFRGGLAFKAHRLCVSLNSRLESNEEEEEKDAVFVGGFMPQNLRSLPPRKVDVRLPGKGNSNYHGASCPRTSSLSRHPPQAHDLKDRID